MSSCPRIKLFQFFFSHNIAWKPNHFLLYDLILSCSQVSVLKLVHACLSEPTHPQEGAAGPVCVCSSSICSVPTMHVSHGGDMPLFACNHSGNNSIALLWLCFVTDNHGLCGRSADGDGHEACEKHVWKDVLLFIWMQYHNKILTAVGTVNCKKKKKKWQNQKTLYISINNPLHNTTILAK